MSVSVKCFVHNCQDSFVSIDALRLHSYLKHPGCNIFSCGVDKNCSRKFDKWDSYRKHLLNQHCIPKYNIQSQYTGIPCEKDMYHDNMTNILPLESTLEDIQLDSQDGFDLGEINSILTRNATVFVAKLYSKPGLPRNHVDSVIKDITSFLCDTLNPDKIIKALKLAPLKSDVVNAVDTMLKAIANPFSGLSSEYLRMKYFQSTGDYIPPETYIIDSRVERTVTGGAVKGKMQNVTGQFIPLRKTLKKFFELPDALSSTLKYMNNLNASDVVSNLIQCEKWQTIKTQFYRPHDIAIPIIIYYDDWEPNNALGPHSEKIGCVYANLPALPEECQSKLENIFEVLIFNADDRKSYGNKKIFQPLVEELQYLEKEGILINTPEGEEKVYFPTVLLIGDNLGVNGMCGFVESFSAKYMCRFCKATKRMTESMTIEDPTYLRDSVNYATDVALNDFRKTGIKEEFVFKDVKSLGYDIPNAFAVDCMHDGPEGIAHYTMIPILKHLLELDPLSLETLNSRMYMFDYGQDANNKPPSVTRENLDKKKLKMTASETTVFVRYFGLLVGDMVPEDDEYWNMYLHLYDIFDIFQSRHLTLDIVPILQNLVSEHNQLYMKLTGESLKPKHHFLIHYPRLFRINGPFAPISSMRNEGKHKELKSYTNVCMSRRNILYSLAVKRQISHCYRFILKESILPKMVIGSGNYQDVRDTEFYSTFMEYFPDLLENRSVCFCAKWVEVKGSLYKNGMALTYGVDESSCWYFAEIKTIFITDRNDVIFICLPMTNLGLNAHVRGFEVVSGKSDDKLICLSLNLLNNPFPLCVVNSPESDKYIMPKQVQ